MTARLIMKLKVESVTPAGESVALYTLRHPLRRVLPEPEPGAHVDVRLPDGRIRQYSLCGDPNDLSAYQIAIKREDAGRGGSRWLHDNLSAGAVVHVSAPRNNFGIASQASRHVLIAGGIGVTPFAAMASRLARAGADFDLHLCSRTPDAPLLDNLRTICGDRLHIYFSGQGTAGERLDVAAMLAAETRPGTHVYCCGPQRLTEAVRAATAHWPETVVHFEAFKPTLDENFKPEPFDLRIASTGETVRVPADRSALEVLRERGFALPSSCELGVCGSCECGYRDGVVIHRDAVLGVSARQDRMMLCVSRARVQVTLDL